MKVSICIPIYGVEKYIEKCAVSLFEQTYKDIEYIFVDDCSPDRSVEVLESVIEKYPERQNQVNIIHHIHNIGLAGARNTAVDNATGDYIMHVDSDDWIDKDCVETLIHIVNCKKSDLVTFPAIIEKENDKRKIIQPYLKNKEKTLQLMLACVNCIGHNIWGSLIKKDLYNNDIKAKTGINLGEDYSVMPLLFFNASNPTYTTEIFYHYRVDNNDSYMHNIKSSTLKQSMESKLIVENFFRKHDILNKYCNAIFIAKMITLNIAIKNKYDYKTIMPENYLNVRCYSFPYNIIYYLYKYSLPLRNWIISKIITKLYIVLFKHSIYNE